MSLSRKTFAAGAVGVGLLVSALAARAAPVLRVERADAAAFPDLRAFVSFVNSAGAPQTGLSKENFKVLENKTNEVDPTKVQLLEATPYGFEVAVVVQKSGSMAMAIGDIKKAVSGFLTALGEKGQAALVTYDGQVEVVAPMGATSAAAGAAGKIDNLGSQKLMYDGVAQALTLFSDKPVAKALVVVGDGGDDGSSADVERLAAESRKKRVPIFAVGHSETGGAELDQLKEIATKATGAYAYVEAPAVEDLNKGLNRVKDLFMKQYVVEWKADDISSDKKKYAVDVKIDVAGVSLTASGELETPLIPWYKVWPIWKWVVLVLSILLVVGGIAFAIWWFTPDPVAVVHCPACNQQQMPDWDVCLFCLKAAQATLKVSKGAAVGKVYPLVGKTVKLGKGPENAIKLQDMGVSTNHCGVTIDGGKFEIVDMGSKNGTFVNGKKVQRRFLRNGDVLTVGTAELRFESKITDLEGPDYTGDEG